MFTLLGFCRLAELGERVGVNLWQHKSTSGASLRGAFDHLVANWDDWPQPTLVPMPSDDSEFAEVLYHSARHYGGAFPSAGSAPPPRPTSPSCLRGHFPLRR